MSAQFSISSCPRISLVARIQPKPTSRNMSLTTMKFNPTPIASGMCNLDTRYSAEIGLATPQMSLWLLPRIFTQRKWVRNFGLRNVTKTKTKRPSVAHSTQHTGAYKFDLKDSGLLRVSCLDWAVVWCPLNIQNTLPRDIFGYPKVV